MIIVFLIVLLVIIVPAVINIFMLKIFQEDDISSEEFHFFLIPLFSLVLMIGLPIVHIIYSKPFDKIYNWIYKDK